MRTFFQSTIPIELHESAIIDGASNLRVLRSIVLPLSKPVIAVLVLQYAVGHWNSFFNALLYINNKALRPLQLILRDVLILRISLEDRTQLSQADLKTYSEQLKRAELLKYALIIVSNVPVLLIYPFIQKYFVKGIMIGSVKG
jgi:putative aldouronate transport system permease protein